ncbi:hypothetical protein HNR46_000921 [Haloferula luteola]|uniref:Uncharacterized protein n=1 Tax=Haloferula luteola TaxID=595692 RepID=A0A840V084_9BACT|nr:hypothetical protein [Haloferula luteola]MBB5350693.1 hypothetical protein [Haloferula luteola]
MSASARSPLSGCAILIAAVCMLLFLIGFSIWVPFRQAAAMEKFTATQAVELPVAEVTDARAKALDDRLTAFQEQLSHSDASAELALDAEDLNLAVAHYPQLEELRGTFHVKEVRDTDLLIDICYPLNGRPRFSKDGEEGLMTSDRRYLIGTMRVTPLLSKRELSLRVEDLEVPGAEVDPGFMGHFSTLRILERYLEHPQLGPAMAKLTSAKVSAGKLILTRTPGAPIPDVVSDQQFQKTGSRFIAFLAGALLLFLLLAGTVLFIGYRKQLRKIEEQERTNGASSDV